MISVPSTLKVASDSNSLAGSSALSSFVTHRDGSYYIDNFYDLNNITAGEKGTLFAVILKRNGRDSNNSTLNNLSINTWDPIYGTDFAGYSISKYHGSSAQYSSQLEAAIATAKLQMQYENVTFAQESSGLSLILYNFPGRYDKYYPVMKKLNLPPDNIDPQYEIAYYWTSAEDLSGATTSNTLRIDPYSEETAFNIIWGSTIEIANIDNRLFFKKNKNDIEGGGPIDDAIFAAYHVGTETIDGNEVVYYTATNGTKIYLETDSNNKFTGKAGLTYNNFNGTYTINTSSNNKSEGMITDANSGDITVTIGGTNYTIKPAKNPKTGNNFVGYTHPECDVINADGTGHFVLVEKGPYVIREIKAPTGYKVNDVEIRVLVNNTGVYANAGVANDGLTVGTGIGNLAKNFAHLATKDEIEESLTWMYEAALVKPGNTYEDVGFIGADKSTWNYAKKINGDKQGFASGITTNKSEAMVSYLNYTSGQVGTALDYSINNDPNGQSARTNPSSMPGEGTNVLYAESGWITSAMYQDYAYGKSISDQNAETYYDDFRNLGDTGDVSYLFSGSTYVQIVDEHSVDVNLICTDDGIGENKLFLTGAEYILYKYGENDEILYYNVDSLTGKAVWIANDANQAKVLTTQDKSGTDAKAFFRIQDLELGTYYLEETKSATGYRLLDTPVEFVIDYTKDSNNQVNGYGLTAELRFSPEDISNNNADPYYNEDSTAYQYKLTVVKSKKMTSLRINKFGMAEDLTETLEPLSGAGFNLYYIKTTNGVSEKYYYQGEDINENIIWTQNEENAYVFTCGYNGNNFRINNLQNGIYYLNEKVAPSGYGFPTRDTKIVIDTSNTENPVQISYSGDSQVTKSIITENDKEVTIYDMNVINTLRYELPNFGGFGVNNIYIIGFIFIFISGGGYIVLYLNKKKIKKIIIK